MRLRHFLWVIMALAALIAPASPGRAQQAIGQCVDQLRGQTYAVYPNLWLVQVTPPFTQAQAIRDPSGMNFLRISSTNPMMQAFFVDWSGRIIEINPAGIQQIGFCQFATQVIPQNPFNIQYQQPQMAPWGVRTEDGVRAVPQAFVSQQQRYVPPLYATEQTASQCLDESAGEESAFGDCMLNRMLGSKEKKIYECAKEEGDETSKSLCMIGATGGENERRAAQQIGECYAANGSDWDQYPLCMASQNMDDDSARLLACVRKQSETGDVSFFGTAVCYGAGKIQLNPEQQIAVECAATTGGEPLAFAGCAGGRLTARELTKCLTVGVGGDGCFGPNNEIVKALRSVGLDMNRVLGPNNDMVRVWNNGVNDLQNGPGPNNEVTKALTTVSNDLANGPGQNNDIVQAIDNVIPGFASIF